MPRGKALTGKQVDMIWADLAQPKADKRIIAEKYGLTIRMIYGLDLARRNAHLNKLQPS